MSFISRPFGHVASRQSRSCLRYSSWSRSTPLASSPAAGRRCFHYTSRRQAAEGEGEQSVADTEFWKEYKASLAAPATSFRFADRVPRQYIGSKLTAGGFLTRVSSMSENLCFAAIMAGHTPEPIQIVCRGTEMCDQLRSMRLHSSVSVTGELAQRQSSKTQSPRTLRRPVTGAALKDKHMMFKEVEILATEILCVNSVPTGLHLSQDHNYPPQSRHLQIRFDDEMRKRFHIRARVAAWLRRQMGRSFLEIETPILFKSSPEGAREFLVPTRKAGYAYALPQSPQQYKQILMASGIKKYYQFAKCFRDEDLRADRQPEFTQLDIEMAFADGERVMTEVEGIIRSVYGKFLQPHGPIEKPLPDSPLFLRMPYEEAMSKHGSDKPDLRIQGLIHRIDDIVLDELRGMLTSIQDPIIEACKLRFDYGSNGVQNFIRKFMDSPDAEPFTSNVDGAPGFCIYDSRKPVEGLQTFGFEGAEKLKTLYSNIPQPKYHDGHIHQVNSTFEDGDLLIIQARQNLPHSGGATILGKLRLAIHKAAVAEGLIQPDPTHHYLWVTEFPMFTPNNDTDPGQGGASGFSATHHPFTAPLSAEDVDLLLTDPLKAKADHYDLVVNGVELGGGSRRIHNAEMQKFIMKDIIKMSEERMNDFSHLFEALRAGCPPHAGLAIGFDRLIAVMTGQESVKDVIVFPKSSKGEDMMVKGPARMTDAELSRYHLQLTSPVRGEGLGEKEEPSLEDKVEEIKSEPPSQA